MVSYAWPLPYIEFKKLSSISETRDVTVFHSQGTWDAVKDLVQLEVVHKVEVTEATLSYWDSLCDSVTGDF